MRLPKFPGKSTWEPIAWTLGTITMVAVMMGVVFATVYLGTVAYVAVLNLLPRIDLAAFIMGIVAAMLIALTIEMRIRRPSY